MDTYNMGITVVLFVLVILSGAYQVYTGKALGMSQDIYTKESLDKFARPAGMVQILLGVMAVIAVLGINEVLNSWTIGAGIAGVIAAILVYFVMVKKILVKRKKR